VADDGLNARPVGEPMGMLAGETGTLVEQELDLARAEMTERPDEIRSEVASTLELAREETAQKLALAVRRWPSRRSRPGSASACSAPRAPSRSSRSGR